MKKIIQIIAAPGWAACFATHDGKVQTRPLVCWALTEDKDGDRTIEGFDTSDMGAMEAEGFESFVGYACAGYDHDGYIESLAKEWAEKKKIRRQEIDALEGVADTPTGPNLERRGEE